MDPIKFDRRPYTISYKDQKGELQTIRRVPPPKLHEALPTDVVELTKKRNDDFDMGDKVVVKHINPRHPNTLQLVNDDGKTTFVDFYSIRLDEMVAPRDGMTADQVKDRPERNRYLLWP